MNDDNDALWFDVVTMNVSDINCPNENDGTTMPVKNDINEWIRSPWNQDVLSFYRSLKLYHVFFYFVNVLFIFIPMFDLMLILLKNKFKWK